MPAILAILAFAGVSSLRAQGSNPTSAASPFFGSVTARPVSDEPLKLSLDEAIALGLKNNLGLKEAENSEKSLHGQKNEALQNFLPTITLTGDRGVHQQNLVAMGFGPGTVKEFMLLFPGGVMPPGFSEITRDDLIEGKIQYGQMLFSGP
ncbi:MAG TPA: TolC family protein, partial [Terracidiphilus sp.]|nr:TolC family protein [Terracidiphilus sp.]